VRALPDAGDLAATDGNAEARIQGEIVSFVREYCKHALIFCVPNDGLFSKAEAARRKWQGVLAGVPDLALVGPNGRAYFVEVKAPGGTLSLEQKALLGRLSELSAPWCVVRSLNDMRNALMAWGIAHADVED
jgi:hypothetical protein